MHCAVKLVFPIRITPRVCAAGKAADGAKDAAKKVADGGKEAADKAKDAAKDAAKSAQVRPHQKVHCILASPCTLHVLASKGFMPDIVQCAASLSCAFPDLLLP